MLDANRKVFQRAADVADALEGFDREPHLMRRTILAALEGLGHGGLLVDPETIGFLRAAGDRIPLPPEQDG